MSRVADLERLLEQDALAANIAALWDKWYKERQKKEKLWKEVRDFVMATDTSATSATTTGWRNKTTIPKLCQIRDNLHSNYLAALFPNDNWLRWEGYTADSDTKSKKNAIQAYMSNKVRQSDFIETADKLVYDFIDYGNCFADVDFVNEVHIDPATGDEIQGYVGPKLVRISPLDIVFDPTAESFTETPKIRRYRKKFGDWLVEMESMPEDAGWIKEAVAKCVDKRSRASSFTVEDYSKAQGYLVDGFGNMQEYLQSDTIEVLEIEGNLYDPVEKVLLKNSIITVVDRSTIVRKQSLPSWHGKSTIVHAGWRKRPDNLWAMGPLENLVGMQYRLDHLENLRADAADMVAFPMIKIKGDVDEFEINPGTEIHCIDGDVDFLHPDTTFLAVESQMQLLEQRMEEFAGAPREALGIRSPGEKTAFEVSTLTNAASRVFQEKTTSLEINLFEKALNNMLESAKRNMDSTDIVRVMDDDLGVSEFIEISREDLTATGKLRPVGARHFAAQQRLLQDLSNLLSSSVGAKINPHVSGKRLSNLVNDVLQLDRYDLVSDNVAVFEEQETQRLVQSGQEDLAVEASITSDEFNAQ